MLQVSYFSFHLKRWASSPCIYSIQCERWLFWRINHFKVKFDYWGHTKKPNKSKSVGCYQGWISPEIHHTNAKLSNTKENIFWIITWWKRDAIKNTNIIQYELVETSIWRKKGGTHTGKTFRWISAKAIPTNETLSFSVEDLRHNFHEEPRVQNRQNVKEHQSNKSTSAAYPTHPNTTSINMMTVFHARQYGRFTNTKWNFRKKNFIE